MFIRHLPPDSAAVVALGGPGWTPAMYLTADLFHAFTGKEHPGKPKPPKPSKASLDIKFRLRQARREAELAELETKETG